MNLTKIEWTESTWNPSTGCTKISAGCKNCYAEKMAKRLKAMGQEKYKNGFELTLHPEVLHEPFTWKKSRIVFVNSMSDLFHEEMPFEFIQKVFSVMNDNPQHIFQVLTKRAEILLKYSDKLKWSKNIWMGVTIENQENVNRLNFLKKTNADVKFLSFEPLIGEINSIDLKGIDWVIVGGESGIGARPMQKEWVLSIKNQCLELDIPFFFKQWGGVNKKKNGRMLENQKWSAFPKFDLAGIRLSL
jgi:protein gp37